MKFSKEDLLLYAVTDSRWLNGKPLAKAVEEAIAGGATCIQLREKHPDEKDYLKTAKEVQAVCKKHGIPFVINDDVDLAVLLEADGVHVGQSDTSAKEAKKRLHDGQFLGVSVTSAKQAEQACKEGADYLGAGAVFATGTKDDASDVSIDTLARICAVSAVPVVAIGGIDAKNFALLADTGIAGAAVVSAVFAADDIAAAAAKMKQAVKSALQK
jgi:thiamine-phosphate diphosphorylase